MAGNFCALVENGQVITCIIGNSEEISAIHEGTWIDSSFPVWIPGTWNETDGFQSPKPFPSWIWDGQFWNPPIPYPLDGNDYNWNETEQNWVIS